MSRSITTLLVIAANALVVSGQEPVPTNNAPLTYYEVASIKRHDLNDAEYAHFANEQSVVIAPTTAQDAAKMQAMASHGANMPADARALGALGLDRPEPTG